MTIILNFISTNIWIPYESAYIICIFSWISVIWPHLLVHSNSEQIRNLFMENLFLAERVAAVFCLFFKVSPWLY